MTKPDAEAYAPAVSALLADAPEMPLGPGQPNPAGRPMLDELTAASLCGGQDPADPSMAAACLSGLWLRHNFLEESHTISQGIDNPTGSFWHAIMHRREPDYGNSLYWWARVGDHEAFASLGEAAAAVAGRCDASAAGRFADAARWDPRLFVEFVRETASGGDGADLALAVALQEAEWSVLFDYCYQRATGRT